MIITDDPHLLEIGPNTVIWRYMDLAGFLSIIVENVLFFPRADKLVRELPLSPHILNREISMARFYPKLSDDERLKRVREAYDRHASVKRRVYVNSWHRSRGESYA